MNLWIIKLFPICAVAISVLACCFPGFFSRGSFLIVPLLGFIMLGMGTTLSLQDFLNTARKPRPIAVGMILQFMLMPLLAFIIGKLFSLPEDQFIGLVMVGCVAGGTASNVITYLAGGDVALSISMTACSTVAGIVLTPLLAAFYLRQTVEVPAWLMFESILQVVALPVALGMVINRLCRKKYHTFLNSICPIVSAAGIVLVIGIIVSLNTKNLFSCGIPVLLAVVLHNASGMLAGYYLARLCRCDAKSSLTIAIEVGMQNSGLAAALAVKFFGAAAALPGSVFSVWHNISGSLLATCVRRREQLSGKSQSAGDD